MSEEDAHNEKNKNIYLSYGIGFGLLGGALLSVILGMFFKSPFIWGVTPGIGMVVGMIIGISLDANKNKE